MESSSEDEQIKDQVEEWISSQRFCRDIEKFCLQHCSCFQDTEENKLEYTHVFNEFCTLFETKLDRFLKKKGSTREEFLEQLQQAEESDASYVADRALLEQILAITSFEDFKVLMLQVKADSEGEAEESKTSAEVEDEPV
mmetsp:Transcript_49921/g.97916  ORF Transcript_49921/g.97916 Transcript_49921/m.97916 type:complete len:140 (-) Transcript_49921:187-606(-)